MFTNTRLAILAVLAFGTAAQGADTEFPFVGHWSCEVATFTFTKDSYNNGSDVLHIRSVDQAVDGALTLHFDDDYAITLSPITKTKMGWYSSASGDAFECRRIPEKSVRGGRGG